MGPFSLVSSYNEKVVLTLSVYKNYVVPFVSGTEWVFH